MKLVEKPGQVFSNSHRLMSFHTSVKTTTCWGKRVKMKGKKCCTERYSSLITGLKKAEKVTYVLPWLEVREIHLFFFKPSSVMAGCDFELEHQDHCVCMCVCVYGGQLPNPLL